MKLSPQAQRTLHLLAQGYVYVWAAFPELRKPGYSAKDADPKVMKELYEKGFVRHGLITATGRAVLVKE